MYGHVNCTCGCAPTCGGDNQQKLYRETPASCAVCTPMLLMKSRQGFSLELPHDMPRIESSPRAQITPEFESKLNHVDKALMRSCV